MFRRRSTPEAPAAGTGTATAAPAPAVTAAMLAAEGWILPKGIDAGQGRPDPAWTLIGTVGSPLATAIDPAGLVVGEGWSLDWWIGADDRWHHPAREAAVRQGLVDDAPIVETLVRIPGGDAAHRAYGIRAPRRVGDEWVVVEVENRTPVPLAAALVIRPLVASGLGAIGEITVEPVAGGAGRDVAHLVRVDGRPSLVLPRRPAGVVVGNRAGGDAVAAVEAAPVLAPDAPIPVASCPDGLATMALVLPVAHTAVLRVALPVGDVDPAEPVGLPNALPDAATVASGWEIHRRGPRLALPEQRLEVAFQRSRTRLPLALDGEAVHRDGRSAPDLDPGTAPVLEALAVLDQPHEAAGVIARWNGRMGDPELHEDVVLLHAVASHWTLHRDRPLLDWMLPEASAAIERIDRADRKGALVDPLARARARTALDLGAAMLATAGQPDAAEQVTRLADRLGPAAWPTEGDPADLLAAARARILAGDPGGYVALLDLAGAAGPTGAWPGPGTDGRRNADDLAAPAALVTAVRALLVDDRGEGLALLPVFPDRWYGNGIELHDAPTAHGTLSYAVRWHGRRPALLWELVPHEGDGPVTLTVPGLDATWQTCELKGDALLAEVEPPEGLDLVREVAEHPGLQEHMRPEADAVDDTAVDLPEGGTFS